MDKLGELLCRIGVHDWTPWEASTVPLVSVSSYDEQLEFGEELDIKLEMKIRECERCGTDQTRRILHW